MMERVFRHFATVGLLVVAGGCVAQDGFRASSTCPAGLTYSCTASVGQKRQCICASREELREILNPVNDY